MSEGRWPHTYTSGLRPHPNYVTPTATGAGMAMAKRNGKKRPNAMTGARELGFKEIKERIVKLRRDGLTYREIAQVTGKSAKWCCIVMQRYMAQTPVDDIMAIQRIALERVEKVTVHLSSMLSKSSDSDRDAERDAERDAGGDHGVRRKPSKPDFEKRLHIIDRFHANIALYWRISGAEAAVAAASEADAAKVASADMPSPIAIYMSDGSKIDMAAMHARAAQQTDGASLDVDPKPAAEDAAEGTK